MISTIWLLLFCGIISEHLASSQKSTKVKKNNLKVHINATGDTLVMKFLRPNENLKLEGFVLGYGSNFFSNQYIQWPENGKSYVTEVDAEPRYLIALKPNENSKKTCKDKNPAAKPLQLVIGTLTPTSTFLSWGILINPQIDWSVLNKCPNDRFYTVRYREKNKDWMYQLCPTTEIVIDSLKPSTMYEFGVKDNTENGIWSKLYNHKTIPKSKDNGQIQSTNKISKAILQMASEDTKALIPVTVIKQGFLNLTYFNSQTKTASESTTEKHKATEPPSIPKTTKKPNTEVYKPVQMSSSPSAPKETLATEKPLPKFDPKETHHVPINVIRLHIFGDPNPTIDTTEKSISPKPRATTESPSSTAAPTTMKKMPIHIIKLHIFDNPEATAPSENLTTSSPTPKTTQPHTISQSKPAPKPTQRVPINDISHQLYGDPEVSLVSNTARPPPLPKTTQRAETPQTKPVPNETRKVFPYKPKKPQPTAQPRKPASTEAPGDSIKPKIPPQTPEATFAPYKLQHSSQRPRTSVGSRINPVSSAPFLPVQPTIMRRRPHATNVTGRPVEATVFSPTPKSEIDALGKIRTTGPHITYMTKKQEHPCSITESLKYFPTEEATNQEIVSRPMNPPSNLTIVTVEGCPSFVILDWQPPENDTVTEYKIISTENGAPPGKDQSIITTNQTFQTVENLKPNASYQFLVIPTNPLGEGPASNTVEFSTESADPRVSEPVTGGKDAIWTEIKFKSDSYSECKGKQFVKRTWYKKFVGIQLCNSLRYKIYLSDSLLGTFYNIGDQSGFGEDHCQFVDSFLDGRTGQQLSPEQLTTRKGFYRAVRQQPVDFGNIGGNSQIRYVHWYECGIAIPGKW